MVDLVGLFSDKMADDLRESERLMQDRELINYAVTKRSAVYNFAHLFCGQFGIDFNFEWQDDISAHLFVDLPEVYVKGDKLHISVLTELRFAPIEIDRNRFEVNIKVKRVAYDNDQDFYIEVDEQYSNVQLQVNDQGFIHREYNRELDLNQVLLDVYMSISAEDFVI